MYINETDMHPGVFYLMAGDTEDTTLLKTRHRARAEAYQAALEPLANEMRRLLEAAARVRNRARWLTDDWEDGPAREELRKQATQIRDLMLEILGPAREEAQLPPITAGQIAQWLW